MDNDNLRIEDHKDYADEPKHNIPISQAIRIASVHLNDLKRDAEDERARESLTSLVSRILEQSEQSGSANDFHNFAVALAREDFYGLACHVIECGISLHSDDVDLLADYLLYGKDGGKETKAKCQAYYERLTKISRNLWTWRGFAFAINYLLSDYNNASAEKKKLLKSEMLSIVKAFRKYYPYSEESYRAEAIIYGKLKEPPGKELEILQSALKNDTIGIAPKCALRCADILVAQGRYNEALIAINRVIQDSNQAQRDVNESYIYYLSALCRLGNMLKAADEASKETIEEIYRDFDITLSDSTAYSTFGKNICDKVNAIIGRSGFDIPERYNRLIACIADHQ